MLEREQEQEAAKLGYLSKVSTDADLYHLLNRIDEETNVAERVLSAHDDVQLVIGPYTVFASCKAPEISSQAASCEQTDFADWDVSDSPLRYLDTRDLGYVCPNVQLDHDELVQEDFSIDVDLENMGRFIGPEPPVINPDELVLLPDAYLGYDGLACPAQARFELCQQHTETIPRTLSPWLSAKAPCMPSNVRYLLSHYATVVIDSLSAIPLPEQRAPWRGLHLSCAMTAYGELDIMGTSSLAKTSLLYSLLSLTCFHLSSLYNPGCRPSEVHLEPGTKNLPSSQHWREQAERLRAISRTAFRKHLEAMIADPSHKQKYKETLMASMSLVCVGIISGDVWDSRMYIMQSEDIIRRLGSSKRTVSKKALQLHRLFAFISILDRTTFCHSQIQYNEILGNKQFTSTTNSPPKEVIELQQDLSVEMSCIDRERLQPSDLQLELSNDAGFENLCGVPGKIFKMIADTNTLIDKIDTQKAGYSTPQGLSEEISAMEDLICNYESELIPSTLELDRLLTANTRLFLKGNDTRQDASAVMSTCMRDAVYNALLVYFFREVRNKSAKILQHYVRKVLVCLETHQQIKLQEFPSERIGLIVWPAFVVACEALGSELRQRAVACIRHAADAGFRNGETAETVVREVWKRRDAGSSSVSWREVVRYLRIPILLT